MKKVFIPFALIYSLISFSQEKTETNLFNRWSVEANVGQNKALRPFTSGYYSSDPTVYFNINGIEHYDLGIRYMLTPLFGFKLDYAQDVIKNNDNASLLFENKQHRIGFQGVANLARILQFESFTNRIGLLLHAGLQVSKHVPQLGVNKGISEDNGGVMFGLTPQLRITNRLVVAGDFTVINNVRQHFNWDGSYAATDNNLTGLMYNTSLGITLYLGKKEKHADWYLTNQEVAKEDKEARKRLDKIETLMNDTDKDGVADYLDQENNTPAGIAVDTRGKYIDTNKNGVPDELERKVNDGQVRKETINAEVIKEIVSKGFINIFYDVNKDTPNSGSTANVYNLIQFLRQYPAAKIKLTGYADLRGDEQKNIDLSQRRAQNLSKLIINSGIEASRVQVVGQGVDNNYTKESSTGFDLARRVSLTIE